MTELVVENKVYAVVPMEDYIALQKNAALKVRPEKVLTVEEARAYSKT